jgi:uncharacterized protein YdeI (YjbR/CyaY-like superfamily)
VQPKTRAAWRAWLQKHHARPEGVWLVSWKRTAGRPRLEYEDAVQEALCFGWIDGQARSLDAERSMIWMAPRRKGAGWAATNKARIERLVAAGLMTPAGLARIEAAKADGSWTLLDSAEALEVPDDLAAALRAIPPAAANFEAFPRSDRKVFLAWIASAKRPATRAARIAETAARAARNQRSRQQKAP